MICYRSSQKLENLFTQIARLLIYRKEKKGYISTMRWKPTKGRCLESGIEFPCPFQAYHLFQGYLFTNLEALFCILSWIWGRSTHSGLRDHSWQGLRTYSPVLCSLCFFFNLNRDNIILDIIDQIISNWWSIQSPGPLPFLEVIT